MDSTRKLSADILSADANAFTGLKTIVDYNPSNQLYTVSAIQSVEDEMKQLQTQYLQLQSQINTISDKMIKKEQEFHDRMIGAKTSVEAQFGRDSNELQTVGKKKISEYKKRTSRSQPKNGSK